MLRDLLGRPEVHETFERRGRVGFMAIHGGNLERVTDVVARESARRSGASCYVIVQDPPSQVHVPSSRFDPADSPALAAFVDHVDVIVGIHGYGRDDRRYQLLLGGGNRTLAAHVAGHLRSGLDASYEVVDRLDDIPVGLRGVHPANPVNLARAGGVQIELPPTIRWNRAAHDWCGRGDTPRTPDLERLIDRLAAASRSWPGTAPRPSGAAAWPAALAGPA